MMLIRRDPRVPTNMNEFVVHTWVTTNHPQPEGYPPGLQLFVERGYFEAGRERTPRAEVRAKLISQMKNHLTMTWRWYIDSGFTFDWPTTVWVLSVDQPPEQLRIPPPAALSVRLPTIQAE